MVRPLLLFFGLWLSVPAFAAVQASIDRAGVELNESFTLTLSSDTSVDVSPDTSVLEEDFHVGQASQQTNTTIMQGQIRRSKTWSYVLMPKRAGKLTIPAIQVGADRSEPLTVEVSEPSYAPPGEADVFITTELDFDETYVQAQVLLTTKIYRAVPVRQPGLGDPVLSGAEVLVEMAGDDRNYAAVIDGKAYDVAERVIAIYPQESGEIELSPARFEARVLRDGRITGRKVFESEPLTLTVLPTPPLPDDYPNAAWLPARDVTLTEDWSRDELTVAAGEPLTRHITISALGQLETQLPAVPLPEAGGLNVYPDKPELSRRLEPGGIRGIRQDQYALIGVTPGTVTLPAVELPWWDLESEEWRVASLPERTLEIMPSAEPPVAATDAPQVVQQQPAARPATDGVFWRRVSELLAALLVLTLAAWWWTSRPRHTPREPRPMPVYKQQAKHLKVARKAALDGDAAAARRAMLDWARLQWPDDAPRSVGSIAARVSAPLADELQSLSRLSYGPESAPWDGRDFARALRSFAVTDDRQTEDAEALPRLLPATSDRN